MKMRGHYSTVALAEKRRAVTGVVALLRSAQVGTQVGTDPAPHQTTPASPRPPVGTTEKVGTLVGTGAEKKKGSPECSP